MVVEQNRPKNGALRIQIVRQRPFEVYVNSHKFRFVFALVSRTPHFDAISLSPRRARASCRASSCTIAPHSRAPQSQSAGIAIRSQSLRPREANVNATTPRIPQGAV